MSIVYLALGSNIGEREKNCEEAVKSLESGALLKVLEKSTFYETKPVGGPRQRDYINGVIKAETLLSPYECLERIKKIEEDMGRVKTGKDHPRIIDIDIIVYDDVVLETEILKIPHPRMHKRMFVLKGLKELAPDFIHPVLQKSINDLFNEISK